MKSINFNIAYRLLFLMLIAFTVLLSSCTEPAKAQTPLFTKIDSVKDYVDTIATVETNGYYEKGAFTLLNSSTGDTLRPQVRYNGTSQWVTARVKNIKTGVSDTNIIITASGFPVDFEIENPVIDAFRLVKPSTNIIANRVVYVYYRFWRR